jgi:hypothetical protein
MGVRSLYGKRQSYARRMTGQSPGVTARQSDDDYGVSRSPGARWAKTYRSRVRRGLAICWIELGEADIDLLIRAGTLDPKPVAYTREQVSQALRRFLDLCRQG